MTRNTVNVLSISWAGKTARKLVGNILNVLMMCQLGFSQVHCPCPYSVFTMSWVRKLVFVPSVIPVIEEDSNDIPILEENRDPIPVPPPRIRNAENVEIVEMASQVSRQRCIRSLG